MLKKAIKLLVIAVFMVLFISNSQAQNQPEIKELFLEAESYFLFEEYKEALALFQRVLKVEPQNYNVHYRIGRCYLADKFQKEKSVKYLEEAVNHITPDYKEGNFKEKNAPLEALFYLADAYLVNNMLNKAMDAYTDFQERMDTEIYDQELVLTRISKTKTAMRLKENPKYYLTENLGDYINSRFNEMNPVISADGNTLVFTRQLQFYDAVFIARKVNGQWTAPYNLTPEFGLDGNSYATGLSADGNLILVYRNDNYDGNIYQSRFENDRWGMLTPLNDNINTKYWESHASLSADGNTLVFTSNRKGGYGLLDIYKSELTSNGDWGVAKNLGPVINSEFNEESPFLTEGNRYLFFSSQGHENMGGFDIFKSRLKNDGSWTTPENIGYPVNTTHDDIFFAPVEHGDYAYYAMFGKDTYGLDDIYHLEIFSELHPRSFTFSGKLNFDNELDEDIRKKIQIVVEDYYTGKIFSATHLGNADDEYNIDLTQGTYNITIEGPGIETRVEQLNIAIDHPADSINLITDITTSDTNQLSRTELKKITPPPLKTDFDTIYVQNNQEVQLSIEAAKGDKLTVHHILNNSLLSTTEQVLESRKYTYTLKPQAGENILNIITEDEAGNIAQKQVKVVYQPEFANNNEHKTAANQMLTNDAESLSHFISNNASEPLIKAIKQLAQSNIEQPAEIYYHLQTIDTIQHFHSSEVDSLYSQYYAYKNAAKLYNELLYSSEGNLNKVLHSDNIQPDTFSTPAQLLSHLTDSNHMLGYNHYDILNAMAAIITHNQTDSSVMLHRLLLSGATNDALFDFLNSIEAETLNQMNAQQLLKMLYNQAKYNDYSHNDLFETLLTLSTGKNIVELYEELLFFSTDTLQQYLVGLNLNNYEAVTSQQFIYALLDSADKNNFTSQQLIQTLTQAKEKTINTGFIKQVLTDNATGGLRNFIASSNQALISTGGFSAFIDYLLKHTSDTTYTSTDVIKMLVNTTGDTELALFADKFTQYANQPLGSLIRNTDLSQFGSITSFVEYLLSQADKQPYTNADVIDVLKKMAYLHIIHLSGQQTPPDSLSEAIALKYYAIGAGLAVLLIILLLFYSKKRKKNK